MNYKDIIKSNFKRYTLYVISFISIVSSVYFINKYEYFSPSQMFLFIIALCFLSISAVSISLLSVYIKKQYPIVVHKIKKYFRQMQYRLTLLKSLNKILKHKYYNHSVEIVFAIFEHFYSHHLEDINAWEFPKDIFPEGKYSLTKLHKYIVKTREDNFNELNNLEFDDKRQQFSYWGEWYNSFSYRIKDDELIITPNDEVMSIDSFYKKRMKIENDMYNLDNEKAQWIIERRKYLMI